MNSTCIDCALSFRPLENDPLASRCGACCYKATGKRGKFIHCSMCGEKMQCGAATRLDGRAAHQRCRRKVHGTAAGYSRGCRCRECTDAATAKMREYTARKTAEDGVSPSARAKRRRRRYDEELMACAYCGDRLGRMPANGKRGYHRECRLKVPYWLAKGEPGPRQRAALKRLAKAAEGTNGGQRVFTQGACNWCGSQFMSSGGSFYCSGNCRLSHRRKLKDAWAFSPTPSERLAVYERDGWVCQLCERPVDPNVEWPDRRSPSLDHVVPQSHALVPDHSVENLQLAHLVCNSYRQDDRLDKEAIKRVTGQFFSEEVLHGA